MGRSTVASLPKLQRAVFVLRRIEGLSYEEIAGRLGLSPQQVERHLAQALAQLIARPAAGFGS